MVKTTLKEQFKKLNKGAHIVSIYKDKKDCLKIDSDFIIASIENHERCIYIEGNIPVTKIKDYLKNKNIDIAAKINKKEVIFLKKEKIYNNDLKAKEVIEIIKSEAKRAIEDGCKILNIIGEIDWFNDLNNFQEKIINYEKRIDKELFDEYPIKTLCKYKMDIHGEKLLKAVIELHPYLVWENTLHENPYYIPIDTFKDYHNNQVKEVNEWLNNIKYFKKEKDNYKNELAEEKDKFEFLFNQIDDALFVHGITDNGFTKFQMVNEQAVKSTGYSRNELLKMQPKDIDSSKNDDEFYKDKYEKLIKKRHVKFITEHITKNGDVYPVENKSHLFDYKDEKLILTIARDITDRVKKEKELENKYNEIRSKNKKLDIANRKMKRLVEIITELTKYSFKKESIFLKKLFDAAFDIIPEVEYGSVYIYDNGRVVYLATKGHDLEFLNNLNLKTDNFNKVKSYKIIHEINNDTIQELLQNDIATKKDIEKHIIPVKESMLFNITSEEELIGGICLDISHDNNSSFSDFSFEIFKAFYNIAQSFYMLQSYNKLRGKFSKELALSMIHMLEFHDQYTIGHSENVAILASDFAEYLKLDDQLISRIYWAGLVHDIGKIIVPSYILSKKGKLTTQEFEIIKNHPKWAFETLKRSRQLSDIAEYVLYHHENWDGSGYPNGLSENNIPLISQIISLVDSWDAMRSNRAYRDALSYNEAIQELIKGKNTQHNERLVNQFITMLESQNDTLFSHK